MITSSHRDSPGGRGEVEWGGISRSAAERGSELMSFYVSLPALDWWHHLAVLSITSPLPPAAIFTPSHLHCNRGGGWGGDCLFLNRLLNLFGLGVMGHLHGEHSEVSAITTGLCHPPQNMLSFR